MAVFFADTHIIHIDGLKRLTLPCAQAHRVIMTTNKYRSIFNTIMQVFMLLTDIVNNSLII